MKVAYYVSQYPRSGDPKGYFWGGTGEAAAGLAEAMSILGHGVTVFTSSPDNRENIRMQNGVRVIECPSWGSLSQARIAPSLLWAGLRSDFDLVHAHAGNPPAPFGALWYHLERRVPLVVTYHGDPEAGYGSFSRRMAVRTYQGVLLRYLLRRADALYVPSLEFLGESRVLALIKRPLEELPNGINPHAMSQDITRRDARKHLGIAGDARVILFLGSLSPYKGPDILLEAVAQLQDQTPSAIAIFVGDGLMRNSMIRHAKSLGVQDRVRFEGFVPESAKTLYFRAADVFVLPSISSGEVFPIAILEAFAHGLPVLASDLRTFRRFVREDQNGLVVPRGDSSLLAEVLATVLGDKDLREKLSAGARATAKEFNWEDIAAQAQDKYLELVDS